MAPVKVNGKLGFIDKSGKLVIDAKYDEAENFSEGLAGVELNGKWGYINIKGDELHINKLSIDTSEVIVEGNICNIFYTQTGNSKKSGSLIGKIFK